MKSSTRFSVGGILILCVLSALILYNVASAQTTLEEVSIGDNTIRIRNVLEEPVLDV
jgi:hypothetical protein